VLSLRSDVLSYLQPPLLAHLRVVLGSHYALTSCDQWSTLSDSVRDASFDIVVADPFAEGVSRVAELVALVDASPWTPFVVYTTVSPPTLRAVAELVRAGASHVLLHRYDDEPRRFLELLDRLPGYALSSALLRQIGPGLGQLTPPVARAVERLFRRPTVFVTAGDLAASAEVTVRTVYRQLAAAGFESPRMLIVGARLLRAYAYARAPGQSLEEVAHRLGYSAPRMLTRHMREMVGITPRAARRRMRVDEFVATLAGRLYPHRPPTPVRTATLSVS
jgi:AraC-like DNA-binding protein